jgi:hypothetical protein
MYIVKYKIEHSDGDVEYKERIVDTLAEALAIEEALEVDKNASNVQLFKEI